MADELGNQQSLAKGRFFQTAARMAAIFVVMDYVYEFRLDSSVSRCARHYEERAARMPGAQRILAPPPPVRKRCPVQRRILDPAALAARAQR
jgi:hypothetical protein